MGVGCRRGRRGDGRSAWAVSEDGAYVGAQDVGAEAEAAEERGGGEPLPTIGLPPASESSSATWTPSPLPSLLESSATNAEDIIFRLDSQTFAAPRATVTNEIHPPDPPCIDT
uniref:Uncharacterized protein n=1 Tax=Oryza sativa subsp. japonica TaxID=39947 RepID=Q9AUQ6_ORYSJ|nr:hypothetical protein [Oryza sativa Japonica Group]